MDFQSNNIYGVNRDRAYSNQFKNNIRLIHVINNIEKHDEKISN